MMVTGAMAAIFPSYTLYVINLLEKIMPGKNCSYGTLVTRIT